MTCKDCVHYDLCASIEGLVQRVIIAGDKANERCGLFKPKFRFVELPCEVGQTVWVMPTKENRITETTEMVVRGFAIGSPCNVANCFRVRGTSALFQPSFDDFGKTVFLSREEAENALKERVK